MILIGQAFAEEAAAASSQTASGTPVFAYLFILIGAYEIVSGLMTVISRKLYGSNAKSYEQYTDESVTKATPYLGFSNLLCGLFLAVIGLKDAGLFHMSDTAEWITVGIVFVIAVTLVIYTYKKVLVKKEKIG